MKKYIIIRRELMKNYLSVSLMIILLYSFMSGTAHAGNLKPGIQGSYLLWDSGAAAMNVSILENQIKKELDQGVADLGDLADYENLEISDPETTGYMFGPVLSYETDDKKWEFRGALMWFGKYTTSVDSTVSVSANFPILGSVTQPLSINTTMEMEYRDIDLRVKRMITDTFGLLAGYNFQSYKSEIESDYGFTFSSMSMSASMDFTLDSYMHLIYLGVPFRKEFSPLILIKGSLGGGIPVAGKAEQELVINSTFFNEDITNNDGKVVMAYLVFGDVMLGIRPAANLTLWAGYQYRRFSMKFEELDMNADGISDESADATDIYHRITFLAEYNISL
jgi:hypothetical protein